MTRKGDADDRRHRQADRVRRGLDGKKLTAYKPVAPRNVSRWQNPVGAYQQKLKVATELMTPLRAGTATSAAASGTIDQMQHWLRSYGI